MEAVVQFNSEAIADEKNNVKYEIVNIFTSPVDNILTVDNQVSDNRYPVKFMPVPSTCTDDGEG